MTKIRQRALANRIVDYLVDPSCFHEGRFDASCHSQYFLNDPESIAAEGAIRAKVMRGLCFGPHIELVMILLRHAYGALGDQTSVRDFATSVSAAMQQFAAPFADGDTACYLDPSFLLHGLRKKTLKGMLRQLQSNSRIIHETLAGRQSFLEKYAGPRTLAHDVQLLMEEGSAEDFFGICCYMTAAGEKEPHGTDASYIAKASFFLDVRKKTIIVLSIQGQRVQRGNKERSRAYARLAACLGTEPRIFVFRQLCGAAKSEGYEKVKVVRPCQHPMFIDRHEGFFARYEPMLRAAGLTKISGCYLQGIL